MKYLKVAGSCVNQTPLAWKSNCENLIAAIESARSQNVHLLCLPELSITGYGCEDTFFSTYILENSLDSLRKIVAACKNIVVTVGLPMSVENCLYNVVCLIENQKILGFVAKQELAGDGIHYEPRWFKCWQEGRVHNFELDGEFYPFVDVIFEI